MIVDVRGYSPSDLKVNINGRNIEITASREQSVKEPTGVGFATRTVMRVYELPMNILCDQINGNILPDGTLYIAAPWMKQNHY